MSLLNTEDDGYSGESRRKHLILAALWIALIGIGALVTVYAIAPLVLKTPAVVKRTVLDVDLKDAELAVLTNIDFGYCVPGEVSGDVYVNVVNSGNVPIMISSINLTDPVQAGASELILFATGGETAIVAGGTRELMLWVFMPANYVLDVSNFQVALMIVAA
jgi:hypothetical protein